MYFFTVSQANASILLIIFDPKITHLSAIFILTVIAYKPDPE